MTKRMVRRLTAKAARYAAKMAAKNGGDWGYKIVNPPRPKVIRVALPAFKPLTSRQLASLQRGR